MVNGLLALLFVFSIGFTAGGIVTRWAVQRRERRRLRRIAPRSANNVQLRVPRGPQAVRREMAASLGGGVP